MLRALVVSLLTVLRTTSVKAAPEADRVLKLPLFGPPPTPQYSGYLDGSDGCDTSVNGAFCKIHYWFSASERTDDNVPVVLWLNGGPGSSSILGYLQENGPLLINATGGLMENPWSWTKVAHLFVIESPVGVGYSYCAAQMEGKVCQNTDKFTASTARAALVDFFTNKFPELASLDFFITGESYAGVYIPTLAKEILDSTSLNLVGLAVGDPCTDNTAQADSMDALWYGHKYGLVDDATFDTLSNKCHARISTNMMKSSPVDHILSAGPNFSHTPECKLAFRKFMLSTSSGLSQSWKDLFIDDYSLFAPVSNVEDTDMQRYMNRQDVKAALHVSETPIDTWPYPTQGFDYTKEYDACNESPSDPRSMIDFYRELAPQLKLIWVYNGDTDPCVSYEGTRVAVARVGFPEVDGGSYRPWFYNHTATPVDILSQKAVLFGPDLVVQNTGAQFGGEVVDYENRLSFITFHGSGHMVPQFRPQAALHFLYKFINYEDLTPLLPSNETLLNICDHGFERLMEKWTEDAKSAPYVEDWTWMERNRELPINGNVEVI